MITKVYKDTAADKQGVVVGDLLTGIDDVPFEKVADMPPSTVPQIFQDLLTANRCFVLNLNGAGTFIIAMKDAGVLKAGYMNAKLDGKWRQGYCVLWNGLLIHFKDDKVAVQACELLQAVRNKVKALPFSEKLGFLKQQVPNLGAGKPTCMTIMMCVN